MARSKHDRNRMFQEAEVGEVRLHVDSGTGRSMWVAEPPPPPPREDDSARRIEVLSHAKELLYTLFPDERPVNPYTTSPHFGLAVLGAAMDKFIAENSEKIIPSKGPKNAGMKAVLKNAIDALEQDDVALFNRAVQAYQNGKSDQVDGWFKKGVSLSQSKYGGAVKANPFLRNQPGALIASALSDIKSYFHDNPKVDEDKVEQEDELLSLDFQME